MDISLKLRPVFSAVIAGVLGLLFVCGYACAAKTAPSDFSTVIGHALVCQDQVESGYMRQYMSKHFGKPEFVSGGASWWRVDNFLYGASVKYVFVGDGMNFLGATLMDPPESLIKKIAKETGIAYTPKGAGHWVGNGGHLLKFNDRATPSKMYCLGWPGSL
jgi:hypothetical protein